MKRKLHIVVVLGILATFTFTPQMQAAERSMVLSGSGGYVAEISEEIWNKPFTAATGIKIKRVASEAQRMAQLEAMIQSGKPLWDVTEVSASNYPIGVQRNLFEPIDYSLADPDNLLPEVAKLKYGVAVAAYSVVLVVRKDKLPKGKMMKSWADFWNFKEFPGPRSLNGRPQDNFEFALLADGVDPKDLYKVLSTPEGIQRAFDKMEELKHHVPTWWTSGAQSVQLLSEGEVFYCTTYNGRVTKLVDSGVPAEIVWNGGSMHMSYLGIPKGAKNIKEAYEYIRFRSTDTTQMREYIKKLPYPGFAPGLYDGLPESVSKSLPTYPANLAAQFAANEEFWSVHIDKLQERWSDWLLQ
jgi:putative spermidine/putrescine transport system substrate-binding protein